MTVQTPTAPKAEKATVTKQRICAAGRPTWLPNLDRCNNPTVRPAAMLCQTHEEQWKAAGGRAELGRLRALVAIQRQQTRDARETKAASIETAKADHSKPVEKGRFATKALATKAAAKRAAAKPTA